MKTNKGFAPIAVVMLIIAILAVGGIAYYAGTKNSSAPTQENNSTNDINSNTIKDNISVNDVTPQATYTYKNHGFTIELPKGFIPHEEQSEGGPAVMISLPIGGLAYVTNASFWEQYNITGYTYIKDQKIGDTIFKIYSAPEGKLYWFKRGNVGYEFSLFKFGLTTDTVTFENLLKTFKFVGWPQNILSQAEAQNLVIKTWGGCSTPETCRSVTVTVQNINGQSIVTAIYEGLGDDSVAAEKKKALATYNNNVWTLGNATVTHRCQPGRGHQDFSTALCI